MLATLGEGMQAYGDGMQRSSYTASSHVYISQT